MFFYFLFPWQSRYDRINSQRQTFVRIFRGVIRFMFTFKFIYGLRNRPCPFRVQSKCIFINGNKFKLGHQISRTLLNIVNLQLILDYNKKYAYSIIFILLRKRAKQYSSWKHFPILFSVTLPHWRPCSVRAFAGQCRTDRRKE